MSAKIEKEISNICYAVEKLEQVKYLDCNKLEEMDIDIEEYDIKYTPLPQAVENLQNMNLLLCERYVTFCNIFSDV